MLNRCLIVFAMFVLSGWLAPPPPERTESKLQLYFLKRPVGTEKITIEYPPHKLSFLGRQPWTNYIKAEFSYTERGSEVSSIADLQISSAGITSFSVKGRSYRPFFVDAEVQMFGNLAEVHGYGQPSRQLEAPKNFAMISGYTPIFVQQFAIAQWRAAGRPARLPQLPGGDDLIIREVGHDSVDGTTLTRYAIGNLVWGNETIWLDSAQKVAAASTYAGNLPLEAVAPAYRDALPQLLASADADRFGEMADWAKDIRPVAEGRFAINNVRLIDGTGARPVEHATVVVENGRIASVGKAALGGIPVIDGRGKTLLPGLWEMHAHFAQVDYGPAYLAAGVTTARDLGDEVAFATGVRDLIDSGRGLGPKLLLACLVDGSGEKSFGTTYADTPEQGLQVVRACKSRGYVQMKIYDYIRPDVLTAIAAAAHDLGMTVTGHVPRGMTAEQAVLAGMDQINHLGSPLQMAKDQGLARTVAFFKAHGTVIDPTQAWGELLGRPKDVPIESFEPGFAKAPYTLRSVIGSSGSAPGSRWGMSPDAALLIRSLNAAGVPIVAGTDKALPAHSLHRELELYVKAGIPPLEVIRLATSGSARVMGLDREVGTVAPGKRADLLLVDGDPSRDISALRKVVRVVTSGRMYDPAPLWRAVGFQP